MTEPAQSPSTFCVFRIGELLFALAAESLREVTLRPELAHFPGFDATLAGLWNQGSEFLPVLRLPQRARTGEAEPHMLVLKKPATWALLVDHVEGIESLTCQEGGAALGEAWSDAVIATAEREEQRVYVLSGETLYSITEGILKDCTAAV